MSVFGLPTMKKRFFKYENTIDLHFELMNIVLLMQNQYPNSMTYYCYCNKVTCCFSFFKRFFKKTCAMCRLYDFCSPYNGHSIDGMYINECLDRNSEDLTQLRRLAHRLYVFFRTTYLRDRSCLNLFYDQYEWSFQDWNDPNCYGQLSLRQIIENDKDMIRLNGPEYYYRFTYGRH